ncbi:MAG: PAS domain-containing sensor histidine kinase [Actinomycetota bacterium]|nr:PAS domain-containing sensor histidine kinase [Actinomycetota bacterium]
MSVLSDLLQRRAGLDGDAVDHLQLLLSDWQILADLSFADLLLWVPYEMPDAQRAYLCVGQMRPYTAQTIYQEDLVGQAFPVTDRPMVGRALAEQRVIRDADPDWSSGVPVREEAIPVRLGERIIAVVTREANVSTARSPSQLELTYLQSAGELSQMLADGSFPYSGDAPEERELSPRVGDGIMRFDAAGVVTYASPNAISAYRRLGSWEHVVGQNLADFDPGPGELVEALRHGEPVETEVERHGAIVLRRLLPLLGDLRVIGGLLLVREVTELRRHERALRLKDATIREIHHRVKNNLQTVASLLRLQGRRLRTDEAREALAESVRRISSIALVHETLSQESREKVGFDKVARRIVDMLADGLIDPDAPVSFDMDGSAGELAAEVATPLALVLTELLQNSVEHAFPEGFAGTGDGRRPTVQIVFERGPATLRVLVCDNGVGLPEGTSLDTIANLGLQIARTLVESELGGTLAAPPGQGTTIELVVPLP